MVEHFTSSPSCVSLFFLSRTNFPQNATSLLIRNNVPLQHPEQTIPDITGFQKKLLLFILPTEDTDTIPSNIVDQQPVIFPEGQFPIFFY